MSALKGVLEGIGVFLFAVVAILLAIVIPVVVGYVLGVALAIIPFTAAILTGTTGVDVTDIPSVMAWILLASTVLGNVINGLVASNK